MPDLCQACRIRPVQTIDQYDNEAIPFRLCHACHHRLITRALRPLEYFNLVAIHGLAYELHDDFYDEDGEACAAEEDVEYDPTLAFPVLHDLRQDVERLVDYALVKWSYPQEITPYLQAFAPAQVLQAFDNKLVLNPRLLISCLEIAAKVLGPQAEAWVRYQLVQNDHLDKVLFAQALASCLPAAEAEAILLEVLNHGSERELRERIYCLGFLSGTGPLDWLEEQRGRINTVSDTYGTVCASLGMTWPRIRRWLHLGRPLSLIALDALVKCSTMPDTLNRAPRLRENPPRLLEPASVDEMNQVLDAYLALDSVPRTKNAVAFIKQNWSRILKANT
ncbi:hypothetical protein [Hymenobacter koreensis]|uniref:Uncharacterized protein n=1 Tax=Hymenobacter koreensis TaxID=1084523 RepID=A0ABP8JP45_9BACT